VAVLNAGLGALDVDNSPFSSSAFVGTAGTFDPVYTNRSFDVGATGGFTYLNHSVFNVPTTVLSRWFRCMLYIPSGSGDLGLAVSIATTGQLVDIRGYQSDIRFSWKTASMPVTRFVNVTNDIPFDQLFELTLEQSTGKGGRVYIDGVLIFDSEAHDTKTYAPLSVGGNSSTVNGVIVLNSRPRKFYMSEPLVSDEDCRGFRVREVSLSAGASAPTGIASKYNLPGLPVNLSTFTGLTQGSQVLFECTPEGTGLTSTAIRSVILPLAAYARDGRVAGEEQLSARFRTAASSVTGDYFTLFKNMTIPGDGESLSLEVLENPVTASPWSASDFPATQLGVVRNGPGTSPSPARVYSFSPVLVYADLAAPDPLDGVLSTQAVAYTMFEDRDNLNALFGTKGSQAISYTVYERLREPEATQAISYTVGTEGLEPWATQGAAYTVYLDLDAAAALTPRGSQSVAYTILGHPEAPLAFQGVSYTVYADQGLITDPLFTPVIIQGRLRY